MFYLGRAYENGLGVAVDLEKAAFWYLEALKNDVKMGTVCFQNLSALAITDPENAILRENADLLDEIAKVLKEKNGNTSFKYPVSNFHALKIFKPQNKEGIIPNNNTSSSTLRHTQ